MGVSKFTVGTICSLSCCSLQTDTYNHLIRHIIISSGVVTQLAGQAGVAGTANGVGTTAQFNFPTGLSMNYEGTFAIVVSIYVY